MPTGTVGVVEEFLPHGSVRVGFEGRHPDVVIAPAKLTRMGACPPAEPGGVRTPSAVVREGDRIAARVAMQGLGWRGIVNENILAGFFAAHREISLKESGLAERYRTAVGVVAELAVLGGRVQAVLDDYAEKESSRG